MAYWHGKIGEKDDFGGAISDVFIDGAVKGMGSWAIMNLANHAKFGRGLGTGMGQKYEKQPDGKWLKIEG